MERASTAVGAEITEILDDLRRIVQVLRTSSRAAERTLGVSGAQLFVLRTLAIAPVLSLNELAERTRTHQSSVSVVVKRLMEAGLVERTVSTEDRRRVELSLTTRGVALLRRATVVPQERLLTGIEAMGATERKALAGALRSLVAMLGQVGQPPGMFFEPAPAAPKPKARAKKPRQSSK